jgi:hypothetical protein
MSGKTLTLAEIPVELRHCMGFCKLREYPNTYALHQATAFIPHDLGESGLHPEYGHTIHDLDEFQCRVPFDELASRSLPQFGVV